MTISKRVQQELVLAKPADVVVVAAPVAEAPKRVTKTFLKASRDAKSRREAIAARTKGQAWTPEEHARFLEALQVFPSGPWEAVAEYVGTKNSRQTMTHAQKYRQKHERQQRGLRTQGKQKARSPRGAAAPYPLPVKREQEEEERADVMEQLPSALCISPLTVTFDEPHAAAVLSPPVEAESPRSGEDECEQLPPIDLDLFSSSMALDGPLLDEKEDAMAPFKLDSTSVLEQLFPDFEMHAHAVQMWSTNSLTDKLEELSALPEDFSQSLGLWVP